LTDPELLEIINVSRNNNGKKDITGILLYSEGMFIQFLEGPAYELNEVYNAIVNDTRHKNIIKLVEEDIIYRSFPNRAMDFRSINTHELETLASYFDPNKKVFENDDQYPGLAILKTFAESA